MADEGRLTYELWEMEARDLIGYMIKNQDKGWRVAMARDVLNARAAEANQRAVVANEAAARAAGELNTLTRRLVGGSVVLAIATIVLAIATIALVFAG
jgi:hypothetical protein